MHLQSGALSFSYAPARFAQHHRKPVAHHHSFTPPRRLLITAGPLCPSQISMEQSQ